MRHVLALLGTALVLAGCSTEDGLRAQELLERAEAAQLALESATFEGGLTFTFGGERGTMQMRGASVKGEGEWFALDAVGIPGAGAMQMQMVVRDGRAWMDMGGGWVSAPAPAAPAAGAGGSMSAAAFGQLARHVRGVRVTENQLVGGKPVTTIAGEIDTQGLLQSLAAGFGDLAKDLDPAEMGVELGDIAAVLAIDERTHLLDSAYVTFSLQAAGETVKLELRYKLTSVNEPVTLPAP